ncbi:UDP-N-acetylglucosamine 2-epimerase (fragment) [Desulfamplus magnetovallimortis]|uniref:UDP-N-acetylglucosamine 2-epimerase n=1 Tax=Desulfamplus magnetovallimortis TaxID=1246637 RepID=A0A1W1H887_9BACT
MEAFGIEPADNIHLMEPLSYMAFLNLWKDAKVALTDSGGLQEETTALGIPCLTIRENTERPITITEGTNALVGASREAILNAYGKVNAEEWKKGQRPKFWDGKASERIVEILKA